VIRWQPTINIEHLRARADLIGEIRKFFEDRNVLEVETPLLSQSTVTDVHLHSITARARLFPQELYLQTSPEYAMKRLLAAGSGSIFQLAKVFRDDEVGRYHNTEFTLLEWYRVGYDHHVLMQEMNELLQFILHCPSAEKMTYQHCFLRFLKLDPHRASIDLLQQALEYQGIRRIEGIDYADRDVLLQLLMSNVVEPQLRKKNTPVFVYDYPASQAALARLHQEEDGVWIAERFEVYFKGIELANGFHELADSNEQRKRFENDLKKRQNAHASSVPIDERLLLALAHGLPDCAGVALGVDRLVMIALHLEHIQQAISFPIQDA